MSKKVEIRFKIYYHCFYRPYLAAESRAKRLTGFIESPYCARDTPWAYVDRTRYDF